MRLTLAPRRREGPQAGGRAGGREKAKMRQWDRVRAWGSREERLGEQREVRRRMERPEEVRAQWSSNPALSMMGFSGAGGGMEWVKSHRGRADSQFLAG